MSQQLSFSFTEPTLSPPRANPRRKSSHKVEDRFNIGFVAALASREKQIQQNYRPVIGIHKWFARRPGTVFRNLLLAEFNSEESLDKDYWRAHQFEGIIADPFMGGGTPIFEANRLGFSVVGADINPMAFWIVCQSLAPIDLVAFENESESVIRDVGGDLREKLFTTTCELCGADVDAKYFLWVKTQTCPSCKAENDLFPGYLLAAAERHPKHVLVCHHCGNLNEFSYQPRKKAPEACSACGEEVYTEGPAKKNRINCQSCGKEFPYPAKEPTGPPKHRMWAIEYHCKHCKRNHRGRFFKRPDSDDLRRFLTAQRSFSEIGPELPIPTDPIPDGDETKRLHRWGYHHFREMFNERQLLGLGLLLRRISHVKDSSVRYALLTVFSDFLRYQNMLARYDTFALKCQDIFSVHGFPVGLVQCENNLIGIANVGSGAFRHFLAKYRRAKEYCRQPFETRYERRRKQLVPIVGERLEGQLVSSFPKARTREAWIICRSAESVPLPLNSLDGVFTDPPYFDNVQYAELMDFCYVWLRTALRNEFKAFERDTAWSPEELTGNETMGRGLDHFTAGLSRVFLHYANALKAGAPFVFTFHHNDLQAYVPLVVAILDAGLDCTATLPAPAEMGASLHIAGTKSSVLDSIFVCRRVVVGPKDIPITEQLEKDLSALRAAGLRLAEGDIRCLAAGHVARLAINDLRASWDRDWPLVKRMTAAIRALREIGDQISVEAVVGRHIPHEEKQAGDEDARTAAI